MIAPTSDVAAIGQEEVMPIAIVGMAFRGPGDATNVENFYKLIAEAREAWSSIPESKWVANAFYHPDPMRNGASNVQGGHFFKQDLSQFDAPFFGMREDEAACLDPQQRMLLECCYEALEDSGTPLSRAMGSNTSVFVGTFGADFPELLYRDPETMPTYQVTNAGNSRAIISNRLSYFFDFKGPSATIDTACSASLVAFHLACQSLRTGDAEQAIVGGSSVILNSDLYISMSAMGFLSPEGRCYSFDERAQGYARGEGVGCLLIKPVDKALRDGDTIRAIVRNTGSNQDGKTPGITYPNGAAQEALIRSVYEKAGLDPVETSYVEAHGTGTQAGDPIEAAALAAVFGPGRSAERPLKIGSVKSNIGHLEGASGIAGLVKAVLMLENGVILPSRNFRKANKRIPLDEWKLQVATQLEPWETEGPRRLSINSFGYGGSNAHAILEDAGAFLAARGVSSVARKTFALLKAGENGVNGVNGTDEHGNSINGGTAKGGAGRRRVFVLSGFDQDATRRQALQLAGYIRSRAVDDVHLDALAYTLSERRTSFPWKVAVTASAPGELAATLEDNDLKPVRGPKQAPAVGFVFTGQGAQWAGMARGLADTFPVFRRSLERARDTFCQLGAPWDLLDELEKTGAESRVNQAEFSQPISSAVQCALVDLLASWEVVPAAVTGHSSGELAAAYCIGALSLEAAMTAAYYRGVVAGGLATSGKLKTKGAMMAVALGKQEMQPLLARLTRGKAVVACENSPVNVTVSGDAVAVDELHAMLQAEMPSVFARRLMVDVAYHSHHMEVIGDEYLACVPRIDPPRETAARLYSSVTGTLAQPADLTQSYWVTNLLSEVRFATSLSLLCHHPVNVLVEIGPHAALAGPIKQIISADPKLRAAGIAYHSALVRGTDAAATVAALVASLVAQGVPVAVDEANHPARKRCPPPLPGLPPYAWNRSRAFWAEGRLSKAHRSRRAPRTDILGAPDRGSNPLEPRWRNVVRLSELPWLRDHVVQGNIVYPAGGYVAMAIDAARQRAIAHGAPFEGFCLREVVVSQALVIAEQPGEVETVVALKPHREGTRSLSDVWDEFAIYSVSASDDWTEHCRGLVSIVKPSAAANDVNGAEQAVAQAGQFAARLADAEARCTRPVDVRSFYDDLRALGLAYGSTFANITAARAAADLCVAELTVPDTAAAMPKAFEHPTTVHPAVVDSMLHPLFAGAQRSARGLPNPMVPVTIREVFVSTCRPAAAGSQLTVYASNRPAPAARQLSTSIVVVDSQRDGPVARIDGLVCVELAHETPSGGDGSSGGAGARKLAWSMAWGLDPALLPDPAAVADACAPADAGLPAGVRQAAWYMGLLGFKNPHLAVLETGGSGQATRAVLSALHAQSERPRFLRYDLARPDVQGLDAAREALADVANKLRFAQLDLGADADVEEQGFAAAAYDVVLLLAPTSTQAFSSPKALQALRRLLRPDGELVISVPKPTAAKFARLLADSGFSVPPTADAHHSLLVARAAQASPAPTADVLLVVSEHGDHGLDVAALQEQLAAAGVAASVCTLGEAADVTAKVCIMLAELAQPFMHAPSARQFDLAKAVLLHGAGVLWVTRGAGSGAPLASATTGAVRTARSENGAIPIVTVDLDGGDAALAPGAAAALVFDVFDRCLRRGVGPLEERDLELREQGGRLLIPRVVEQREVNDVVAEATRGPQLEEQPLVQPGRPLRIDVGTPGLLDSIRWVDDLEAAEPLPEDCLEVEVRASGVNFRDVMMALGQIAVDLLGGECSGVVTRVGSRAAGFAVGDRVAFLQLGSYATTVRPKACLVQHIPPHMSFETAAALPVVFVTAYYALFELAKLRAGETVLVHAAAGGVGQAALELCRMAGADVLVTVGSRSKKHVVMDRFGVPEDRIFFSRDANSFAQAIMARTAGRGVDVVLNSVAGEAHRLTWGCMAPFGRFIELGKRDIFVNTRLEMEHFAKNVTFATFDLVDLIRARPETAGSTWAKVLELLQGGQVRPPSPIQTYSMSETAKALQIMQSGKHVGKLVSVVSSKDIVKGISRKLTCDIFRPDASYLIVGGLGGLGRAIASWMVRRGARNLIFANRRGPTVAGADAIVTELVEHGAAAVEIVACDVADPEQLSQLISACTTKMPPIRGIIHSAMVLRDALFENMTHEDYVQVLRPKIQGALSLHQQLSQNGLDFFVLLSSVSGVIGNVSQANYAAANVFLDAFATHHNSQLGLPFVALDLGVITGVGHVAENTELARSMQRQGFEGTNETELLAMIQHAIEHPQSSGGQVVSGLGTWSLDLSLANLARPMFSHFRRLTIKNGESGSADGSEENSVQQLAELPVAEAAERICAELTAKVAALCMIPPEDVSPSKTLSHYGIDSLVAVELRNWIFRAFGGCTVPILELMGGNSIFKLALGIAEKLKV